MSEYGIILAAGGSSRMGEPKPLLELDGEPLVCRAIRAVRAANAHPVVVLGHGAADIAPVIGDASVALNDSWRDGMSSSLRTGIAQLPDDAVRTLVLTVDQPDVDGELLSALLDACRAGHDASGTRYPDDSLGVPACFAAHLFDQLVDASGDVGARGVLRSSRWRVASLDRPNRTLDVDTPAQWRAYLEAQEHREST